MNFGWRLEPSRQRRRMVSPILGLSQRRSIEREVVVEVGAGDRRQDRDDLLALDLLQEGADQRVGHALVDEVDVEEAGGVGDDRVAAVQDADLHVLEGGDVGDELDAGLLEGRAAGGEAVLEHPLDEVLAEHRPGVVDAELVAADARARGRRWPGAMRSTMPFGKATVVADPGGEARGPAPRRGRRRCCVATTPLCGMLSQESTVKGGAAGGAAGAQAGEDQAEDGLRARRGWRRRRRSPGSRGRRRRWRGR